ncbi:hypothetical protein H632_c447p1 [Helicosporidium sp. ATCC 50920]|nr:hypothetical protein H632_c447p1 [Helicosporidium sp. ATCC 50920]|eukprot:KDD75899.1 hypothetical protein H632_c447p1 [Helicosporidium sp. ATCC 50920]
MREQRVPGLNPCLGDVDLGNQTLNYEQFLQASGVTFSTFSVTVDTMAALHTTKAEMDSLWNSIQGTQQRQVMSVIAFRGENRSEARYIRSNSPSDTGGTGIAEEMGLVVSFARGVFAGFSWYDYDDCVACGGLSSSECIKTTYDPVYQTVTQNTCAAPLADCTCRGLQCTADNCTTTFYTTFQGSDQAGNTLTSQYEIQNISRFSVTNFFSNIFSKITAAMPGGSSNSPGRIDNTVALGGTTEGALEQAQSAQMQFVGRR